MTNSQKREFHLVEWIIIVPGALLLLIYVTLVHFLFYSWIDWFKSVKYTILGLISGVRGNTKELIDEIEKRERDA